MYLKNKLAEKKNEQNLIRAQNQQKREENLNQRKIKYLSLLKQAKKHSAKMKFPTHNLRKIRQIKRKREEIFIKKKLEIQNIMKKNEAIKKIKDSKVIYKKNRKLKKKFFKESQN
jgi:hypothetical protein